MEEGGSLLHKRWFMIGRFFIVIACLYSSGCLYMPRLVEEPLLHNPFPQVTKIAVAPFFNLSSEPTVDGRQFALAYFNELQLVPGYEVIPVGVVEQVMQSQRIGLNSPAEAQRLAQMLGAEALVIGAVTDFSPYYPPRCAMQVEWYAADPNIRPIPPGYGLPLGTKQEKFMPEPLIFEARFAEGRQLYSQGSAGGLPVLAASAASPAATPGMEPANSVPGVDCTVAGPLAAGGAALAAGLAPGATVEPVMRHTRAYNGHDPDFARALADYFVFREDARFGGWQSYLQRSDDFIRFCCYTHLLEMLTLRGGVMESRVVWTWPRNR
jgi:hypothetical protein